jgi:hypothetical protein
MRTGIRVLLAGAVSLAGCSKLYDLKKLQSPADVPDVATFCLQARDGLVRKLSTCGAATQPFVAAELYLPCQDQWQWAIGKGHASYDRYVAADCLAEVEAKPCAFILPPNGELPDACVQVMSGGLNNGDACEVDAECASGLCLATATCPGVCTSFSGAGGPCQGRRSVGPQCARGYVCNAGTCEALLYESQPCTGHAGSCTPGTFCDGSQCQAQRSAGAPCSGPDLECQPGLVCAVVGLTPPTRQCKAPQPAGGACRVGGRECERGAYCKSAAQLPGDTGACASWPATGACDSLSLVEPYGCLNGWCSAGTCTPFTGEASACASDAECAPGAICNGLATPAVCFTSCKP